MIQQLGGTGNKWNKLMISVLLSFSAQLAGNNIAVGRPAYQSSTNLNYVAANAVDGSRNTDLYAGSCTHTKPDGTLYPWWSVDLQWRSKVTSVTLTNRLSPGTGTACK